MVCCDAYVYLCVELFVYVSIEVPFELLLLFMIELCSQMCNNRDRCSHPCWNYAEELRN